jgi:hypothetical protein
MDGNSVRDWAQRLRDSRQRDQPAQTEALLSAFAKIDDAAFREVMVILLEIVASNPKGLAKMKTRAMISDGSTADIIHLDSTRRLRSSS